MNIKILLILTILCIANSRSIADYFRSPKPSPTSKHGEDYFFLSGLINGTALFNNLTRADECQELLPIIHDDIANISLIIRNLDPHSPTFFNDLRTILDNLEHLKNSTKEYQEPCCEVRKDVVDRFKRLHDEYMDKEWPKRVFIHLVNNIGTMREKCENFKMLLIAKDYYNAGYALGDLIRYVLFWDYEQGSLKLLINE
jgi:hypothetical protein